MNAKTRKIILYVILGIITVLWLIPILFIFVMSVTSPDSIAEIGYSLFPRELTFEAYTYLIKNPAQILDSYKISIIVTLTGTVAGLLITTGLAYAMSRKDFLASKTLNRYVTFALLFHGGLIPTYIVVTQWLHLGNTLWVLILTMLVSPWNVFLMRSFISGIPMELLEAAFIDGATEFQTYYKIVLPLAKAGLASVGLLIMFGYWNDWYQGMLYIDDMKLTPLPLLLYKIISNIQYVMQNAQYMNTANNFPTIGARMATCVISIAPMLAAFPFFQKYLAKGLTLGSVKG
ncbi:MAG: carbohydrate ABC transporter permease [Roseburia sp.]|jgi:putative aldouronate transport system permease protein|nr:carbohydrate ABC transporter permease [Roseburia sp.]